MPYYCVFVLKKSCKFKDFERILKIRSDYQNLVKIILQFTIYDSLNSTKYNNQIDYYEFRKINKMNYKKINDL